MSNRKAHTPSSGSHFLTSQSKIEQSTEMIKECMITCSDDDMQMRIPKRVTGGGLAVPDSTKG